MVGWNVTVIQEEEREPLQPESNNRDVKVINDLIEDLTKLELVGERVPLARLYNNNKERRPVTVRQYLICTFHCSNFYALPFSS